MTSTYTPPPGVTPNPALVLTHGMAPAISIPERPKGQASQQQQQEEQHNDSLPHVQFPMPKLRFEIRDLNHAGSSRFLGAVNTADCLRNAVYHVLKLLYTSPSCPKTTVPPTRSVTLVLEDMGGVAYTKGSDLDNDHKEIHFSLSYISRLPKDRIAAEILGVVTHEMVHCYQYNGHGTCPGGLIEGIADWVRLCCRLSPPHWKRETDGKWNQGYQHTAYFLEYLETRFGNGTVQSINEKLRIQRYEEKAFWLELVGKPVEHLWGEYCESLKQDTLTESRESRTSGNT
ncbi:hypothetical protein HJFPF1_00500 [Paramyrothecium foliicola]|nr:hypothetical protein HJFPF1_00500 [Paramyrothecium foliicola]